jgi:hypothetical protein
VTFSFTHLTKRYRTTAVDDLAVELPELEERC